MKYRHYWGKRRLRHIISAPFIWSVLIPVLLLDLFVEIYHRVCFPLYGMPYVIRKNYIKFDRYKLPQLVFYEKINCIYCEYVNGFAHYFSTIAAKTEGYWCGIQHEKSAGFVEPAYQKEFDDREKYK